MVTFAVELENDPAAVNFMLDMQSRVKSNDFAKNPFIGKVKKVNENVHNLTYIVILKPIYPKFYYAGWLMTMMTFVFTGPRLSYWLIPGLMLSGLGVLWSPIFYYNMLRIGLRKHKYKGKLKKVQISDVLIEIL